MMDSDFPHGAKKHFFVGIIQPHHPTSLDDGAAHWDDHPKKRHHPTPKYEPGREAEGQRGREAERQRGRGAEEQRGGGAAGQRGRGAKGQRGRVAERRRSGEAERKRG